MKNTIKKFEQFTIKNSNNIKGGTTTSGDPKYYLEVAKANKLR
ncbi:MAG: hypothetical protein AB8G11_16470 [Saprospiraceae bacterium]